MFELSTVLLAGRKKLYDMEVDERHLAQVQAWPAGALRKFLGERSQMLLTHPAYQPKHAAQAIGFNFDPKHPKCRRYALVSEIS
jgi:hypothetical protein